MPHRYPDCKSGKEDFGNASQGMRQIVPIGQSAHWGHWWPNSAYRVKPVTCSHFSSGGARAPVEGGVVEIWHEDVDLHVSVVHGYVRRIGRIGRRFEDIA